MDIFGKEKTLSEKIESHIERGDMDRLILMSKDGVDTASEIVVKLTETEDLETLTGQNNASDVISYIAGNYYEEDMEKIIDRLVELDSDNAVIAIGYITNKNPTMAKYIIKKLSENNGDKAVVGIYKVYKNCITSSSHAIDALAKIANKESIYYISLIGKILPNMRKTR